VAVTAAAPETIRLAQREPAATIPVADMKVNRPKATTMGQYPAGRYDPARKRVFDSWAMNRTPSLRLTPKPYAGV
jgi:hypothetical protein